MSNAANAANTGPDRDLAPSLRQLELRCQLLDIERRGAIWQCEQFRKLLSPSLAELPSGGPRSAPAQVAPSSATSAQQQRYLLPSPSVRHSVPDVRPSSGRASGTEGVHPGDGTSDAASRVHPVDTTRQAPGPRKLIFRFVSHATPSSYSGRRRDSGPARVSAPRRVQTSSAAGSSPITPVRPWMASMSHGDAPHANSRRLCSGAAAELFLREQGLGSYSLTPQEAAQASQTPDITGKCFSKTFGGHPIHERPNSTDGDIICIHLRAQIYAPDSLGKPGLLFLTSNTIPIEFTRETFRMFLTVPGPISYHRYLGTYTRVPILRTTLGVDEWLALPLSCRRLLTWRIHSLQSPDGRVLHARVSLRRQHGREPSPDEIEEWLKVNTARHQGISQSALEAAFGSGEEKIGFEVVRCVGYDVNVARKMQDVVARPV